MKTIVIILHLGLVVFARPGTRPSNSYLPSKSNSSSIYGNSTSKKYESRDHEQIQKDTFFFASDEDEEPIKFPIHLPPTSSKNANAIFVKAPQQSTIPEVTVPSSNLEEKTLVYVLLKKQEGITPVTIPAQILLSRLKPQLYFIKYKNQFEAGQAVDRALNGQNVAINVQDLNCRDSFLRTFENNDKDPNDMFENKLPSAIDSIQNGNITEIVPATLNDEGNTYLGTTQYETTIENNSILTKFSSNVDHGNSLTNNRYGISTSIGDSRQAINVFTGIPLAVDNEGSIVFHGDYSSSTQYRTPVSPHNAIISDTVFPGVPSSTLDRGDSTGLYSSDNLASARYGFLTSSGDLLHHSNILTVIPSPINNEAPVKLFGSNYFDGSQFETPISSGESIVDGNVFTGDGSAFDHQDSVIYARDSLDNIRYGTEENEPHSIHYKFIRTTVPCCINNC